MSDRTPVAWIVGGGRGLGRAIAGYLAEAGWRAGVLARTAAEVEETAGAIREAGGWGLPLVGDVLDPSSLTTGADRLAREAGGIDALVYAAGRLRGIGPAAEIDPPAWELDFRTSTSGFFHAFKASARHLRRSDRPVVVALVGPGAHSELAFASAYAAAQAALVRLIECLARELQPAGIPVYAVSPGLVPTDLVRHLLDSSEGRRWLPRFTEAFAEGKESGAEVAAEMTAWLLERRPMALSGRLVPAPQTPAILETRLDRIQADDAGRLRIT